MGYLDDYLRHVASLRAESTHETYRCVLGYIDRALPYGLAAANLEEITNAVAAGSPSPSTRALRRAAVRGFFTWACDPARPVLDFNPAQFLSPARVPRRVPRPAGSDTLRQVLAQAQQPYRTWYVIAAYGGLRCCELAALDRDHIDEQTIWVHGKGGHERVIATHPLVWQAVRELPDGPLVRGYGGRRRATRQEVSKHGNHELHQLRAGITMHRLRHWFATHSLESCGDLRVVQELMGHASPNTTAVYTQVTPSRMASAVEGLPTFSPPVGGVAGATGRAA